MSLNSVGGRAGKKGLEKPVVYKQNPNVTLHPCRAGFRGFGSWLPYGRFHKVGDPKCMALKPNNGNSNGKEDEE